MNTLSNKAITIFIGASLALAISGCTGESRGSSVAVGSTASGAAVGAITSGLPVPDRDPVGYQTEILFSPPSVSGASVSALAVTPSDLAVAQGAGLYAVTPSNANFQGRLFFETNQLVVSNGATYASTAESGTQGAGDLWERSSGAWTLKINSADSEMVVAAGTGSTWAVYGSEGSDRATVERNDGLGFTTIATIESSVPTSAVEFGGELWIGAADSRGGRARMWRGTGAGGGGGGGSSTTGYVNDVAPLLVTSCSACHSTLPSAAAAFPMTSPRDDAADFAVVQTKIDLSNATASLLLLKATNDASVGGHLGGANWTVGSAQYAAVVTWIQDGANLQGTTAAPSSGFSEVSLPLTPSGARQEITDMMVVSLPGRDVLAFSVGAFGAAGEPLGGSVVLSDGIDFEVIAQFGGATPNALLWADETIYVGMSDGRLMYRLYNGTLGIEVGINMTSIASLAVEGGRILIGGADVNGAVVVRRSVGLSIGFVSDIAPLLAADCATCHDGRNAAAEAVFSLASPADDQADYAVVQTKIDTGDPASSLLLLKASKNTTAGGHTGGPVWKIGSPQYKLVERWIQQGASFQGGGGAAASGLNFTDDIHPIIRASCSVLACHGGNAGASIYLINADVELTYQATITRVDTATPELSAVLRKPAADGIPHTGGPTPGWEKGTPNYNLMLAWINDGMLKGNTGGSTTRPKTFRDFVYPVMRNTCGAVACHGSANPASAGGFQMDGDEAASYASTVRRVNATNPTRSLVLRKPALDGIGHSGGLIPLHEKNAQNYDLVLEWIQGGMLR